MLNTFWTKEALRGTKNEQIVSAYHKPDDTMPRSKKHTCPSKRKGIYGTIRSVQIKDRAPKKYIALTFDFCQLSTKEMGYNGEIIDFLRDKQIPATLFISGRWMHTHPERTKQLMVDPCFEIGHHGWTHGNFGILPLEQAQQQISATNIQYSIYRDELKQKARELGLEDEMAKIPEELTLLRFPYGRCRTETLQLVYDHGLKAIQWNQLSLEQQDFDENQIDNFVKHLETGSIILMHGNCVPKNTFLFLQKLVARMEEQGFECVTVSELLEKGEPVIDHEGYFSHPGDNLFLDQKFLDYGTAHEPPQ